MISTSSYTQILSTCVYICGILLVSTSSLATGISSSRFGAAIHRRQAPQTTPTLELPWNDPCGGSNPVSGIDGSLGYSSEIGMMASSAKESQSLAKYLRMKYNNNSDPNIRIPDSLALFLNGFHLDNLPYTRQNISDIGVTLQTDYDDVASILVFIENVLANERASTQVIRYHQDISNLEDSLYTTLCQIKIAADGNEQQLELRITREVMNDVYRDIGLDDTRYQRDYIVFKDVETFLGLMSNDFSY